DKTDRWPNARSMQFALRNVSGKKQGGAVSRRSIPDVEPVSDGPTLHADPMFIEELDPKELVDSTSASWRNENTVMADANRPLPAGALPSAITREVQSNRHPADSEGATLAV